MKIYKPPEEENGMNESDADREQRRSLVDAKRNHLLHVHGEFCETLMANGDVIDDLTDYISELYVDMSNDIDAMAYEGYGILHGEEDDEIDEEKLDEYLSEKFADILKTSDIAEFDDDDDDDDYDDDEMYDGYFNDEARQIQYIQHLLEKGVEAETPYEKCSCFLQGLSFDHRNIDFWLRFALYADLEYDDKLSLLKWVADLAKNSVKEIYDIDELIENKDAEFNMWYVTEARPYMVIRRFTAAWLTDEGEYDKAIDEYRALLEISPDDNQGNRYDLISLYVLLDDSENMRALLGEYDEKGISAVWAWAAIYERYLAGDLDAAKKEYDAARKQNKYMVDYLVKHKELQDEMPERYSSGSKEEAIVSWDTCGFAFIDKNEFNTWLKEQEAKKTVKKKSTKKKSAKKKQNRQ